MLHHTCLYMFVYIFENSHRNSEMLFGGITGTILFLKKFIDIHGSHKAKRMFTIKIESVNME